MKTHSVHRAIIAGIATAAFAQGAQAQTHPAIAGVRGQAIVSFGDLDLNTEHGAALMFHRIELAASKACGGQPGFNTYDGSRDKSFDTCRREAIARTVSRLAAPLVTRMLSKEVRAADSRRVYVTKR